MVVNQIHISSSRRAVANYEYVGMQNDHVLMLLLLSSAWLSPWSKTRRRKERSQFDTALQRDATTGLDSARNRYEAITNRNFILLLILCRVNSASEGSSLVEFEISPLFCYFTVYHDYAEGVSEIQ